MSRVIFLFLVVILMRFPIQQMGWVGQAFHVNYILLPAMIGYLLFWLLPDIVHNRQKSAYWIIGLLLSGVGFLSVWYAPYVLTPESDWGKFANSDIGRTIAWSWITFALCWLIGYRHHWVKNGKIAKIKKR